MDPEKSLNARGDHHHDHDQHNCNHQRRRKRIPFSYWISRGYDARYAQSMEMLQTKLTNYSHKLLEQQERGDLHIFLDGRKDVEILEFDPMLQAHWQEFSEALRNCQMRTLSMLCIRGIELPRQSEFVLIDALQSKNILELKLQNNRLGRDGIFNVAQFCKINETLILLDLGFNPLVIPRHADSNVINAFGEVESNNNDSDSDEQDNFHNAVMELMKNIKQHPRMQTLRLSNCNIGLDSTILSAVLDASTNLKELCLWGNKITSEGALTIAQFLEDHDNAIKYMYLDDNLLVDDDVILFSRLLGHNRSTSASVTANDTNTIALECLTLIQNKMTEVGVNALLSSVYDTSSLNSVACSNHKCRVEISSSSLMKLSLNEMNFIQNSLRQVYSRKEKICFVLCGHDLQQQQFPIIHHDRLMRRIGNIPVELMPNVLELFQYGIKDETKRLALIFEVLRGWKMPLLFRFLCIQKFTAV